MTREKTTILLKTASIIVIGFGIIISLAAHPASSAITLFFADLIFWPLDGAQNIAAPETRLVSAITGGVMAGWGVLLWLISSRLYPREPELARTMILWSIGIWFIVDCAGSFAAGATLNILFNLGFLIAFFAPLWRPAED